PGAARRRDHPQPHGPDHRHRRRPVVRRAGPGEPRSARALSRPHAQVRAALRPARGHHAGRLRALRRRREGAALPERPGVLLSAGRRARRPRKGAAAPGHAPAGSESQRGPGRRRAARAATARAGGVRGPRSATRPRMAIVRGVAALRRAVGAWRGRGETVAFVPTMGALHPGHLSLVDRARRSADRVVVSIFVNPLQFGAGEDYRRYPRPLAHDRARLRAAGVDLVWEPRVRDLYPPGERTRVRVEGLDTVLEGAARPGHFTGVATVVAKLLAAVAPDVLWVGQKDAQQARLIEQM